MLFSGIYCKHSSNRTWNIEHVGTRLLGNRSQPTNTVEYFCQHLFDLKTRMLFYFMNVVLLLSFASFKRLIKPSRCDPSVQLLKCSRQQVSVVMPIQFCFKQKIHNFQGLVCPVPSLLHKNTNK